MRSALRTQLRCCVMVDLSATRPVAERDSERSPDSAGELPLRRFSPCTPSALFIGASTGGPQALATLFKELAPHLDAVPVFVVLHMPTDFTSVVAGQIERLTGRSTIVAKHGEPPCPGTIYFAPGGTHMRLLRLGSIAGHLPQGFAAGKFLQTVRRRVVPFGGRRLRAVDARPHSHRNGHRRPRRIASNRRGGR